jgi:hypothetical protein
VLSSKLKGEYYEGMTDAEGNPLGKPFLDKEARKLAKAMAIQLMVVGQKKLGVLTSSNLFCFKLVTQFSCNR